MVHFRRKIQREEEETTTMTASGERRAATSSKYAPLFFFHVLALLSHLIHVLPELFAGFDSCRGSDHFNTIEMTTAPVSWGKPFGCYSQHFRTRPETSGGICEVSNIGTR